MFRRLWTRWRNRHKTPHLEPTPEPKRDKGRPTVRTAADRASSEGEPQVPYAYPIQSVVLPPGVLPEGRAPAVAMDSATVTYLNTAFSGGGFPGYPHLAQLATRAEYRAMASAMATELTREWIKLTSKQEDGNESGEKIRQIEAEMERLNVQGVIAEAAAHDCHFGRAQLAFSIDGADLTTPLILDRRTVRKGSFTRVTAVEAMWTTPAAYNALDPTAADFYKPNRWIMLGQEIHASRLYTVVTRPLPDMLKAAFNFGGMSLSQLAEPYVDNWLRTRQSVADLIFNFSTTALATSMDQVLEGDDDGGAATDLFARAKLFTATRSNRGLMLLDKDREELVQLNTPLSGLHELQAQSQEHMCSVSRMPATVLTGIQPSGLNATADGEMRAWYDWIAAQQVAHWKEPISIIIKLIQLSLFGEIDEDIGFEFVPLYQMTPKEEAEIREADSRTDASYVTAGVLDPSEVRERLARSSTSGYQGLDVDSLPVLPDDANDESVSEAQRRAMEAAAHGHSTLGIPEKVGKEFAEKDEQAA